MEQRGDDLAVQLALVVRVEEDVGDEARDLLGDLVHRLDQLHVDLRQHARAGARLLVHALDDALDHRESRLVA